MNMHRLEVIPGTPNRYTTLCHPDISDLKLEAKVIRRGRECCAGPCRRSVTSSDQQELIKADPALVNIVGKFEPHAVVFQDIINELLLLKSIAMVRVFSEDEHGTLIFGALEDETATRLYDVSAWNPSARNRHMCYMEALPSREISSDLALEYGLAGDGEAHRERSLPEHTYAEGFVSIRDPKFVGHIPNLLQCVEERDKASLLHVSDIGNINSRV